MKKGQCCRCVDHRHRYCQTHGGWYGGRECILLIPSSGGGNQGECEKVPEFQGEKSQKKLDVIMYSFKMDELFTMIIEDKSRVRGGYGK